MGVLDHDAFGSRRSKIMNVIVLNMLGHVRRENRSALFGFML
jgi:hypothetical protein